MRLMIDSASSESPALVDPAGPPKLSRGQMAQRIFAVVFAVAVSVAIFAARNTIEQYAVYGYPGVFLISMLGNATLLLPAPSFAIVFAVGGILNPYWVGLAAGCGGALGEMTGYLAGFGGSAVVEKRPIYQRMAALMSRWGAWIIFLLAVTPNFLFDVGGLMAGSLKMPWWKFLLAAALGKSIRFAVIALFGQNLLALWASWF